MNIQRTYVALREYWSVNLGLIILLWININSGPWNLHQPVGTIGWIHAFRAAIPFIAMALSLCLIIKQNQGHSIDVSKSGALGFLTLYGCIALAASVLSPAIWVSFYFGFAFVTTLVAVRVFIHQSYGQDRHSQLLQVTWCVVAIYALVIVYFGRDYIMAESVRGYDAIVQTSIGGMMPSRSSGAARWCAVVALVGFSRLLCRKGWVRLLYGLAFGFFTYVIYTMQSRGALFGYCTAIAALIALRVRTTRMRIVVIFGAVTLAFITFLVEPVATEAVRDYVMRGQDTEQFMNMTGRTRPWKAAMNVIWDSPLIGFGNWSDRRILGEHVHNAFFQALMFGGFLGLFCYISSWVVAWSYAYRIWKRIERVPERQRLLFYEAAAVLVFFTVRSVSETTTASFSVDLMVMVPVMAYLEVLSRNIAVGSSALPTTGSRLCSRAWLPVLRNRSYERGVLPRAPEIYRADRRCRL